jgi:hypothetical protein
MTTKIKFSAEHIVEGKKVEIVSSWEPGTEPTKLGTLENSGDEFEGVVYDGQQLTAREVDA